MHAVNMQRARAIVYCVSSLVFCAWMLDTEVVRRAVCRAACGPLQLPCCMPAMLLLMPVACCLLHAASLSLHLQRKLRSERRTLHSARGMLLALSSSAALRSCAVGGCCTTHVQRPRDVRVSGDLQVSLHHKCEGGD
jgi:hypothetical protein